MMTDYTPRDIESRRQRMWQQQQCYRVSESSTKPKYYCLSMYPYPSGALHIGHVRNYALSDVDARFHRLLGYNVFHPIGWDSFGLPAENAAILHGISPKKWTEKNIIQMKKTMKRLGFSFDWSRELASHDPKHYQWEQKLFLKLLEDGLAYQKKRAVYWCPVDETVLANEQVDQGRCWRCGRAVEMRALNQWFFKLTAFSQELLDGLETLPQWPEEVKRMQRHWIGKKTGHQMALTFVSSAQNAFAQSQKLLVFIEHLELLFGASHIAITPEHPWIAEWMATDEEWKCTIEQFLAQEGLEERQQSENAQPGLILPFELEHPLSQKPLPLIMVSQLPTGESLLPWVGVPAHCMADFKLAKALQLPVMEVIMTAEPSEEGRDYCGNLTDRLKNSAMFSGRSVEDARKQIKEALMALDLLCQEKTVYRLKDWGVSRQRYWGAPIPVLMDEQGAIRAEDLQHLPVELPEFESIPRSDSKNLLEKAFHWQKVERNGKHWRRLCETFDTFVQSSWYYVRYCSPEHSTQMVDPQAANYWLPIDHYIGGIEHATMHLTYFRFFYRLLKKYGIVQGEEPVKRLSCQGMVLADSFYREESDHLKIWVSPTEVTLKRNASGEIIEARDPLGRALVYGGCCKMSKSKKNGVDAETMIERYGSDAVRFFILFAAPPHQQLHWTEQGVIGAFRFLKRLWALGHALLHSETLAVQEQAGNAQELRQALLQKRDWCIEKVSQAYGPRFTINVGIAAIMEFFNDFSKFVQRFPTLQAEHKEHFKVILKLLHPVIPHLSEELWEKFSSENMIESGWPILSSPHGQKPNRPLVIQLNGKKIGCLSFPESLSQEKIIESVLQEKSFSDRLAFFEIGRVIYVPGKILNFTGKPKS